MHFQQACLGMPHFNANAAFQPPNHPRTADPRLPGGVRLVSMAVLFATVAIKLVLKDMNPRTLSWDDCESRAHRQMWSGVSTNDNLQDLHILALVGCS